MCAQIRGHDRRADLHYSQGEFADKNFDKAIEGAEKLIDLYPFSVYVTQAELIIADGYYQRRRWAEASVHYQDFIDKHPTNSAVPHSLHRLAMTHYKQSLAIDRDQAETFAAERTFSQLVTQYPDYESADDARDRLAEVREDLAARERYVARFYWREKEYYASLSRYLHVIRDYSDTKYYPEALYFSGYNLIKLEEPDEATRYLQLLLTRYPDHKYANDAKRLLDDLKAADAPAG
ncbi:MAG: outer membrane protein assembly factor BamD [Deltaproteobacteria bacterium]|nr:outer membrane protein assembly factor BamD [Deltaproteobacteria bacterium]